MNISNEDLLKEIDKLISELILYLPSNLEGRKLSTSSKLPYKLSSVNYTLCHRFHDIADSVLLLIRAKNYLPASILIRSLMETAAVLFWVDSKIGKYLKNFNSNKINKFLMNILLGNRQKVDKYYIINCLYAIDEVTKEKYPEFRKMYDHLSEFAHPNWAGTAGSYSKIESEGNKVFRKNIGFEDPFHILFAFAISISLITESHKSIKGVMSEFITKCESNTTN